MEAILNDAKTWAALSFAVFLFGFIRYAIPGIVKSLDTRSANIKNELAEAVRLREAAQALLAEFQQKQKEMQAEAESILASAKKEAAGMRKLAEEELRQTVERRTNAANTNIARAEADAMADIQSLIVDLSVNSTRALLATELKDAQHQTLVDSSLEEIKRVIH